jgi:hypothetical protein
LYSVLSHIAPQPDRNVEFAGRNHLQHPQRSGHGQCKRHRVALTGPGTVVIHASLAANGGYITATATVTITTALNVQIGAISPASETVAPETIPFSDTVTDGVTDAINWSATGGAITSGRAWTAPTTSGMC